MKFTKVVVACNICWMQSASQNEREATVTLLFRRSDEPGAQEFRLDLCANHAEKITDVLEYGEKVESTAPGPAKRKIGRPRKHLTADFAAAETLAVPTSNGTPGELVCAFCKRPCKNHSGLSIHIKTKHPQEWERILAEREGVQA